METDDKGDIVQMDITDVFGNYVMRDQRNDAPYHNNGYTSHEFDDITGLNYAHSRYLSAPMHTFMSVDPMLYSLPQSYLLDPQQMNSYAYARNNPIIYTDPTGETVSSFFSSIGSAISGAINSAVNKAKDEINSVVASVTNKVSQITQSVTDTAKTVAQYAPSASTVGNFMSSGYMSSAQSDWQAGNYGWSTTQAVLGAASAVSTVYYGPEKVVGVESGKIALQYGVPISEQIGKTITAKSFGSLKTQLSKVATWSSDDALHHIVMQSSESVFGKELIQSTDNLALLPGVWHNPITRIQMSSVRGFSHYYQYAKTLSFEDAFSDGVRLIKENKP